MPIKIPDALPATKQLQAENIFVMTEKRAMTQHIRPLQLLLVNLMPTKIDTETQILRKLSNTPLQVEVKFLRMASHESKNTSYEHLRTFYRTFSEIKDSHFDGMIVTGAPVEQLSFEEVDYWPELCEIFEWSKTHVHSTLHICWGAQAGIYYHYGIDKYPLGHKMTGVFEHSVVKKTSPLVRGFDSEFMAPHSRNTGVHLIDIENNPKLEVIAASKEAGVYLVKSTDSRNFFAFGHPEYDVDTLKNEYERDRKKMGDKAPFPLHYFPNDDPNLPPRKTWNAHAQLLYSNWLNYYVYQTTPFDMAQVGVFHAGEGETLSDPGSFMVTADGKDRVGVVAALATALADLGVAIDSIDQTIDGDKFHIEISAHVATSNSSFEAISNTLDQVGIDNGFTVRTFSVDSDEV